MGGSRVFRSVVSRLAGRVMERVVDRVIDRMVERAVDPPLLSNNHSTNLLTDLLIDLPADLFYSSISDHATYRPASLPTYIVTRPYAKRPVSYVFLPACVFL